jgi:tRNA A37 threonylcarbamoyladenosine synthetase subunit TsaC/SUA5/YrdC
MKRYIEISDAQIQFLRGYPHPWSFLGKRNADFHLPSWMDSAHYPMLSLRVGSVCLSHSPFTIHHSPLFLTSANLSGQSESKTLAEARALFPGVDGIDGGICDRPPSDIFSLSAAGEMEWVRRNYL